MSDIIGPSANVLKTKKCRPTGGPSGPACHAPNHGVRSVAAQFPADVPAAMAFPICHLFMTSRCRIEAIADVFPIWRHWGTGLVLALALAFSSSFAFALVATALALALSFSGLVLTIWR